MRSYAFGRILGMLPTLFVLLLTVVVIMKLIPGDIVDILSESRGKISGEERAEIEARLGLDESLPRTFVNYGSHALRGDLGQSLWKGTSVSDLILDRLPVTATLAFLALTTSIVTGITIGVVSASARGTKIDYALRSLAVLGLCIPHFALAALAVIVPTLWFGWSPSVIFKPADSGLWVYGSQFAVPALVLGTGLAASLMRLTRTVMLNVLGEDYVRTAYAKGLASGPVILRHAMPNALIPVLSLLGLQFAALMSGTIVVESVFGLPGMGRLLLEALNTRDYPLIQGIVLTIGVMVVVINLVVDLSYGVVDPRTRAGR